MPVTSILKKVVMALTGLALVGFLVTHLGGNLLIYAGPATFNGYAGVLDSNPLIPAAEIALLALFLIHAYSATKLTLENRAARPRDYEVRRTAGESTFSSRNMWITGLIVAAFLVLHVWQFKYGPKKLKSMDGVEHMRLFELVTAEFQRPVILIVYLLSMGALGLHIAHGISSAFQSLGLLSNNRRTVRLAGFFLGWLLALGFASLPLYAYIMKPEMREPRGSGIPALKETLKDERAAAR